MLFWGIGLALQAREGEFLEPMNTQGITQVPSKYPVPETVERLQSLLRSKGIKIFAVIDQAAEAANVGLSMRPTVLLIFGDPKTGTPLMNRYPSIAMDLPLKALISELEDGTVTISYNSPEFYKERHQLDALPFAAVGNLINATAT